LEEALAHERDEWRIIMKPRYWPLMATIILLSPPSIAQGTNADENASCRAIFHRSCYADTSAAPAPILGAGIIEGGVMLVGGFYWWMRRRRKGAAEIVDDRENES